ncbi:hypothetical protein LBMAG33_0400 [Candidatus Levyibacteriota bacterium]|nr:hypothetical protein [Candidatus Levybacteria bacterium]GDX61730.1 hypothetical protein LBMAG33_0400 [Candidatus Levybacteria bacterium]
MKRAIALIIGIIFLIASTKFVNAVVTTIVSDIPLSIISESFTITATISGATAGTNYLRVDLYKDQTINYFGETFNGSYWYTGSEYAQFLPIVIQSGASWTGLIQARTGNPSITEYDGMGIYKLRIRRYTTSGSYTSSEASVNAVTVNILVPTQTPTPYPTVLPTITASPQPTSLPEPTTIVLIILPSNMPKQIATLVLEPTTEDNNPISITGSVLGNTIISEDKVIRIDSRTMKSNNKIIDNYSSVYIVLGIGVFCCAILAFYVIRKKMKI